MVNDPWYCPRCGTVNTTNPNCDLCGRAKDGTEKQFPTPVIRETRKADRRTDPEIRLERESVAKRNLEALKGLKERIGSAGKKLQQKDSLPPRGTIRLVVANDWTGWVQVAIVIGAIIVAVALIKILF